MKRNRLGKWDVTCQELQFQVFDVVDRIIKHRFSRALRTKLRYEREEAKKQEPTYHLVDEDERLRQQNVRIITKKNKMGVGPVETDRSGSGTI